MREAGVGTRACWCIHALIFSPHLLSVISLRLNADSDVITKRLGAVNTGGHQSHNLEVPSINNNNNNNHLLPPRGVVDHKDIQNPQIAKPVGVADMNANNAHANSPGMMLQNAVIPKDQENIQIAHPWAKRLRYAVRRGRGGILRRYIICYGLLTIG